MIRFAVCRHPAQCFFKTWRYALNKPGANNRFGAALEQCLTGVFAVDAGFFRTLTTQHFRINKTFTTDATVIGLFRRLITRRAGNRAPRRLFPLAVTGLTLFVIAGGATATVGTRFSWTPAPFPGTRVMGTFIRIIITADIHHFDLAAFTFHLIVHAFLHQRCAKRADYPKCARFAMISYQSLRLSYLLNKTDCCLEQCPR